VTSLLGRLLPLFIGARRVEDLFTEAVARLFERRPELCLSWFESLDLITPASVEGRRYVRVTTQKSFVALHEHDRGSRPDLIVEVHQTVEDPEMGGLVQVVMIESKIGSWEGHDQLKRYAGHLSKMSGMRKSLVYITRAYDPKDEEEVLLGTNDVRFKQLRWHDFYRFLHAVERDALIEEVMAFMEEQGMARSYLFSAMDIVALSGVPRVFNVFDETLGGEVKADLESFAGNKLRHMTHTMWELRNHLRYGIRAPLHGDDLFCDLGYQLGKVEESAHSSLLRISADGYPAVYVFLEAQPGATGREVSVSAMKNIAFNQGWEAYNIDDPTGWAGVRRAKSLADLLSEEDHVAAVKAFFMESIGQLREELAAFKQDHRDLLWEGR
jgi:hypothetical protein